jgi:hypothetical protein
VTVSFSGLGPPFHKDYERGALIAIAELNLLSPEKDLLARRTHNIIRALHSYEICYANFRASFESF